MFRYHLGVIESWQYPSVFLSWNNQMKCHPRNNNWSDFTQGQSPENDDPPWETKGWDTGSFPLSFEPITKMLYSINVRHSSTKQKMSGFRWFMSALMRSMVLGFEIPLQFQQNTLIGFIIIIKGKIYRGRRFKQHEIFSLFWTSSAFGALLVRASSFTSFWYWRRIMSPFGSMFVLNRQFHQANLR